MWNRNQSDQRAGGRTARALLGGAMVAMAIGLGPAARANGSSGPDPGLGLALTEHFGHWLDRNGGYPAAGEQPAIRVISARNAVLAERRANSHRDHGRTRGLYDPETATIYLVAPWDPADPRDASVLLHELVHHRQQAAKHWYCAAAQEWDAYRLQERWLAEHGIDPGFYWPAIALESSCVPRDIHPD